MKNGDKIRNMTADKLAKFIHRLTLNCEADFCIDCPLKMIYCKKIEQIEQWLESEAE